MVRRKLTREELERLRRQQSVLIIRPAPTAPAPVPSNTAAPVMSGTATQGETLSVTNGTWSESPTGYTYFWTANGTTISGATGNTYVLTANEVGKTIQAGVIASNANGPGNYVLSNTIGPIAGTGGGGTPPTYNASMSPPELYLISSDIDGTDPVFDVATFIEYNVGGTLRLYRRNKAGTIVQTYTDTLDAAEATDTSAGTTGKVTFNLSTVPAGTWRWDVDFVNTDNTYSALSNRLVVGPDDQEAILSAPTATPTGYSSADIGVTTDKGQGKIYYVGVPGGSSVPSNTQIIAGQNASNSAALIAGNIPVTTAGAKTKAITGLSATTTYDFHFTQDDEVVPVSNKSAVVSTSVTTPAQPVFSLTKAADGVAGPTGSTVALFTNLQSGVADPSRKLIAAWNSWDGSSTHPVSVQFEDPNGVWSPIVATRVDNTGAGVPIYMATVPLGTTVNIRYTMASAIANAELMGIARLVGDDNTITQFDSGRNFYASPYYLPITTDAGGSTVVFGYVPDAGTETFTNMTEVSGYETGGSRLFMALRSGAFNGSVEVANSGNGWNHMRAVSFK